VITHNLPIAEMAGRVVTLHDGSIQEERHNPEPRPAQDIRW
jgi:ABC-type lipoprotein export system ATPase subunit